MNKHIIIQTDGASRGNPGPAATGIILLDATASQTIAEFGSKLGRATNNEAEYQALLEAVTWLLAHPELLAEHVHLDFRLDSLLVVNQMQGLYGFNESRLQQLADNVQALLDQLPGVYTFTHIPRSQNARADRFANQTLDS